MSDTGTFTSQIQSRPDGILLNLAGPIDDQARLPTALNAPTLTVDLEKVTRINSVGIRLWCQWASLLKPPQKVILDKCPFCFVRNFSSVKGFLSQTMIIRSFFVPHYSADTGESLNFLAIRDQHFTSFADIHLPQMFDSKGNVMEVDIVPEIYFSFLKS